MSILFRSKGSAAEGIVKLVWPQMRAICTSNALFAEESLLAPKKKGKTSQVRDPTLKEAIKVSKRCLEGHRCSHGNSGAKKVAIHAIVAFLTLRPAMVECHSLSIYSEHPCQQCLPE